MLIRLLCRRADETKFAWKIQRDMAERGHSLESIKVGGLRSWLGGLDSKGWEQQMRGGSSR